MTAYRGTVGSIFTLSARGFDPATFRLLAKRSNHLELICWCFYSLFMSNNKKNMYKKNGGQIQSPRNPDLQYETEGYIKMFQEESLLQECLMDNSP